MGAVTAVDVQRRVCFGVAFFLCFSQGLAESGVFCGHIREDIVAGPVDDAVHRSDIVCRQSCSDCRDNWYSSRAACFKGYTAAVLLSGSVQFIAVFS